jgi:nickel/cobalt transporter (NicO) family protein
VLSFASAFLQALVAVLIVGIGAALLGATSVLMCRTADIIEVVSYGLIAAVGAWLIWVKGRGFVGALAAARPKPVALGAAAAHDHAHHHHHDHAHHGHDHVHDEHCGHAHGPEPKDLAGPGGWRRGLAAIVAVGLRPCSGALLVLVFALAQGILWVGVAATFAMGLGTALTVAVIASIAVGARSVAGWLAEARSGAGMLALRGLEVAAAVLVLAFGVLLLAGYLATERLAFC